MISETDQRLHEANEAWHRLFQNTKSLRITNIKDQTHNIPQQGTLKLSMKNFINNQHWGDILQEKKPSTTRIYSQNVNGLKYQRDGGQYLKPCKIIKEVQADVMCMQEHNLDTTQYQVQHTLHQATRKQWQRAKLTISSSPISFQGTWKPGGTAVLSVASITGRLAENGHDPWGRWSYQTLRGQRGIFITIISAYQVIAKHQAQRGQYTSAAQQHSLLVRQRDQLTDPRKAF